MQMLIVEGISSVALIDPGCAPGSFNLKDNPRSENHPLRPKDCTQMSYHIRSNSEELNLESYLGM